jgi:uncharacterized protein Yka (UPF0111/DUF47 family)
MLSWFQALMPREEKFFDHFARHAQVLVAGADALRQLLEGGENVKSCCERVFKHENEADAITHEVMLAVRRTCWFPLAEAATLVNEPELQQVIRNFAALPEAKA